MRYSFSIVCITGVLFGCGGGGGGGGSASPIVTAPEVQLAKSSTIPSATAGDYYTYRSTSSRTTEESTNPSILDGNFLFTKTYLAPDQLVTLRGDFEVPQRVVLTGAGGGHVSGTDDRVCAYAYAPAWVEIPETVTVGKAWESSTTLGNASSRCGGLNRPVIGQVKGSATGNETVAVPAGKFDTIKLELQTIWKSPATTEVHDKICWRDVVSGMNIKCITTVTTTAAMGGVTRHATTDELLGYATAATGKRKDVIGRFAGTWKQTSESGFGEHVSCELRIDPEGAIKGTCRQRAMGVYLSVAGTIDIQGKINLKAQSVFGPNYFEIYSGGAGNLLKNSVFSGNSDILLYHY